MSTLTVPAGQRPTPPPATRGDDVCPAPAYDIRELLRDLSADWNTAQVIAERRVSSRRPCDCAAWLTSLDEPTTDDGPAPIPVRLTDISRHGIGLSHADPLPYRLVQIVVEADFSQASILVVRLQWCRFRQRGVYESGGQIQRVSGDRPST